MSDKTRVHAIALSFLLAAGAMASPYAAAQASKPAAAPASGVATPTVSLPYHSTDISMGVVNCANSLCHGSVEPIKDSNILQTEYVTWSRVDKHARAYQALFSEKSLRIARNLGLGKPSEAKICLDCHTHNVPKELRGERFRLDDGVACEACHGPSGRWLETHVQDNATHADNVKAGLYSTAEPLARARLCLSCHFGNGDRFVSHRLMGAGHPRMAFELDTFTAVEPAHFKTGDEGDKRKRMWDGVQVWAIGQALAVSEMMDTLTDGKRGHDGLFPELVLFDCHACHHPMSDKRWTPRTPALGPGVVRLNDSNMQMVRQIARVVDAPRGAKIAETMTLLQQGVSSGNDAFAQARVLQVDMNALIPLLAQHTFTDADMRGILSGLINEGLNGQYQDYADAEQATMAIGSVASFMYARGIIKSARNINAGLAALQKTVANDERFNPAQFQAALLKFRGTVGL
jgi:Cytochrome c554 and c-prime